VTVRNTEEAVKQGDGWTAWSVDFAGWLKQSAAGERQTAAAPPAGTPSQSATPGTDAASN
jgi:hypothetical protein